MAEISENTLTVGELMDGNYVHLTKDDFKTVKEYELDIWDIYKASTSDCADIRGIPLTGDWFLRMGFLCLESDNSIVLPVGTASELNIEQDLNGEYNIQLTRGSTKGIPGKDFDFVYAGPIKHVHQVQNLYFALTGEKLLINE